MKLSPKKISLLFLLIQPAFVFANGYRIGESSKLNLNIWQSYQPYTPVASWNAEDRFLINSTSPAVDINLITNILDSGAIVILDNSALNEKERIKRANDLMGVGTSAPIIIAAKRNGKLKVNILNPSYKNNLYPMISTETNSESVASENPSELLDPATKEKSDQFINQQLEDLLKALETESATLNNSYGNEQYRPGKEMDVRIRSLNMSCFLADNFYFEKRIDYCDGGASIDINYNFLMLRSIPANGPNGERTKNTKYVRVSVSSDNGTGAGIHLRNNLIQDNTWYRSNMDRDTRIGPFAESYVFWVHPVAGSTPLIVTKWPENANTNYSHTQINSMTIGVNGTAGAKVSDQGPELSAEVSASYSYSSTRSMSWNTQEYQIKNITSGSNFHVVWERSFNECQELLRDDFLCTFTSLIFWDGKMWDETKFSPLSYANFVPNLDVLYEMPINERGATIFELGAQFTAKARYGKSIPGAGFGTYIPKGASTNVGESKIFFSVDWASPIFMAEAHVRLRSLDHNSLCLGTSGQYSPVYSSTCSESEGVRQKWGLDNKERYVTMTGDNLCLERLKSGQLSIAICNDNLSQKWYWEPKTNTLFSRYADGTGTRYLLTWEDGSLAYTVPESRVNPHRRQWRPELINQQ